MSKIDDLPSENHAPRHIAGKPYPAVTVPDWEQIGTFGAGIAIGALIGAATALLMAPGSGESTRQRIRERLSFGRDDTMWDELGDELKQAASHFKKAEVEEIEELEPI